MTVALPTPPSVDLLPCARSASAPALLQYLHRVPDPRDPPFHEVFRRLDWEPFSQQLREWEFRYLRSVPLTAEHALTWGEARQVFRLERRRFYRDRQGKERYAYTVTYGITRLGAAEADAARLLELVRGYWGIEVRSHWVRDTTLRVA